MYYTTAIYESAGMNATEIAFATVGFSTLNMLMTGVSVWLILDLCSTSLNFHELTHAISLANLGWGILDLLTIH